MILPNVGEVTGDVLLSVLASDRTECIFLGGICVTMNYLIRRSDVDLRWLSLANVCRCEGVIGRVFLDGRRSNCILSGMLTSCLLVCRKNVGTVWFEDCFL